MPALNRRFILRSLLALLCVVLLFIEIRNIIERFHRNDLANKLQVSLQVSNESLIRWFDKVVIFTAGLSLLEIDEAADLRSLSGISAKVRAILEERLAAEAFREFLGLMILDGNQNVLLNTTRIEAKPAEIFEHNRSDQKTQCSALLPKSIQIEGMRRAVVRVICPMAAGQSLYLMTFFDSNEGMAKALQLARFGETGETYAVNSDGVLISPSRFVDSLKRLGLINHGELRGATELMVRDPGLDLTSTEQGVQRKSQQQTLTTAAKAIASATGGSNLDGFRDYRGVPVVGAWLWNERYRFGLTHEIDVAEAYATLHHNLRQLLVSSLLFLVVITVAFFLRERQKIAELQRREAEEQKQLILERMASQSTNQQLQESASLLIHEISQPVTTILNASAALQRLFKFNQESLEVLDSEKVNLMLSAIRTKAEFTSDVIMRTRSELNRTQISRSTIALIDAVNDALRFLSLEIEESKIQIDVCLSSDLKVHGDEVQLGQVFVNILRNAMEQFSHRGGENASIKIQGSLSDDSRYVKVSFLDNAGGFSNAALQSAFFPGFTSKPSGSGLGLSIVKRIIESHQGHIKIQNVDGGAFIEIKIPCSFQGP